MYVVLYENRNTGLNVSKVFPEKWMAVRQANKWIEEHCKHWKYEFKPQSFEENPFYHWGDCEHIQVYGLTMAKEVYVIVRHNSGQAYTLKRDYSLLDEHLHDVPVPTNDLKHERQQGWHGTGAPEWTTKLPVTEFTAYWMY